MPLIFGIGSSCRYAYLVDGLYTGAFLDQRSHRCLVPALARVHQSRPAELYTFMLHISRGGVCWRCVRRARRHTCPSPTQQPCLSQLGSRGWHASQQAATSVLVYEALSYECIKPYATSVWGLELREYEAISYECMRPYATGIWGLKLRVYEALSYWCMRP